MKCPECGAKTMFVYIDIDNKDRIVGCEECFDERFITESITEVCEDYFSEEEEDDVDEDGHSKAYWDWYDMKETEAIEARHGII